MFHKTLFQAGWLALALVVSLVLTAARARAEGQLDQAVAQQVQANRASAQSQQRIDELSEESDKLAAEYRSVLQQIDALRVYSRQMEEVIRAQGEEAASLREQINNVERVGRQVTPLMLEMIATLEAFVDLDVPFLLKERTARVASLRELMGRADVADAERYRRILEAYQIENEYGRTIEAYRGDLKLDGGSRAVDFLRVGRIALIYRTLDGAEAGVWDRKAGAWVPLSASYRSAVRQGLRIARKQAAPDLLRLPVPSAEVVQ